MVPTATHAVGPRAASSSATRCRARASPVRFNLREGSDSDRNAAILSVGALGSGKTTLAQKLEYEGVPAGRAGDRLRPQGRPPLPPARGGRAARRERRAAPRPGAARDARPAARRARAPAPGRGGLVSVRPAARARRPAWETAVRRRRRPRSSRAPRRRHAWRSCARSATAMRSTRGSRKALEIHARSGTDAARLRRPRDRAARGRALAGDLPADPRPPGAGSRDAALPSTRTRSVSASRSCG